jgi:hypothetical protein
MRPFVDGDLLSLTQLHAEESFWWFPLRRAMTEDESAMFLSRVIAQYDSDSEPALHAVVELSTGDLAGWAAFPCRHFCPKCFRQSRLRGDSARRFVGAAMPRNSVPQHLRGDFRRWSLMRSSASSSRRTWHREGSWIVSASASDARPWTLCEACHSWCERLLPMIGDQLTNRLSTHLFAVRALMMKGVISALSRANGTTLTRTPISENGQSFTMAEEVGWIFDVKSCRLRSKRRLHTKRRRRIGTNW